MHKTIGGIARHVLPLSATSPENMDHCLFRNVGSHSELGQSNCRDPETIQGFGFNTTLQRTLVWEKD
jgi:hypothetical protein